VRYHLPYFPSFPVKAMENDKVFSSVKIVLGNLPLLFLKIKAFALENPGRTLCNLAVF
jgi:hypothetical protein